MDDQQQLHADLALSIMSYISEADRSESSEHGDTALALWRASVAAVRLAGLAPDTDVDMTDVGWKLAQMSRGEYSLVPGLTDQLALAWQARVDILLGVPHEAAQGE